MGFGRAKVILLGEHGVVHGRPALAAGLARGVQAEACNDSVDALEIRPWNKRVTPNASSSEPLDRALHSLVSLYAAPRSAVKIEADVAIPGGAGLGCSAALGVAIVDALDELYGIARTPAERATASLAWERVFHGNPSGVDSAMAAAGGIAVYRRGAPLEAVAVKTPVPLVIGFSGHASSTKTMVDGVAAQHASEPRRVGAMFDEIADLVAVGRLAIETGDFKSLGRAMNHNHELLVSLRLSTPTLDSMCAAAIRAGAAGAKLTGAGGGGCVIALAETPRIVDAVLDALRPLSADAFAIEAGA